MKKMIRRGESNPQPCRAFPSCSWRQYWQRFNAPSCAVGVLILLLFAAPAFAQERPRILVPLYAGQIGLQAFDGYSTYEVIRLGGVEKNPHVNELLTREPARFVLVKAGVSALSIVAAETLWRHGKKKESVFLMIGANSAMAYVAIHNARVLHQMQGRN